MIKMQIIGNLGKDCVVNTVNGKNVINFTVAHTDKYKDGQGVNQEKTTWVDCSWWIDRTAVAQYLTKGKQVYVEGQPEARAFLRNDGSPGASISLRVRDLQLLGGRGEGTGTSSEGSGTSHVAANENSSSSKSEIPSPSDVTEPIDDLPF